VGAATVRLGRTEQNRVVGVSFDVLLEILGAFERLSAKVALVRLQGHVDTDVRSDVVPLDCSGAAVAPLAGQVQVVGAFTANMTFTDVILRIISHAQNSNAASPTTEARHVVSLEECLRRVARQRVVSRRSFATGRQVGHQTSLQRRRASLRIVEGCPGVVAEACLQQQQPLAPRLVRRSW
jgi:hypothetical protein